MIRPLDFEEFSSASHSNPKDALKTTEATPLGEDALSAQQTAFEDGYRDGWAACLAAEDEAHRRIGAELAVALKDLTLTHADARRDVLKSLAPLFEEIAGQLLPSLAAEAVAPTVIAELEAAAVDGSEAHPTLVTAEANHPALARLAELRPDLGFALDADPDMGADQVSLRFDTERRDIDLSGASKRMADALRAFITQETGLALEPPRKDSLDD